ncbi:hypothetical protein BD626DRAFT_568353 [Schizophyllum amplum]|uniref:MYND-type domain-containing protein n=1 Tax=Schizophyllum amplum TaxID=97359 RepID=A0A550CIS0_9AGAR|nr:hypothetical protein BD626DRAFT_568353 [Auriculariopsis ampla]
MSASHEPSELSDLMELFMNMTEGRPTTLSPQAALAKLKAALARGRLFRGFDEGPPQRKPNQPPLPLPPSATYNARHELKRFGVMCSALFDTKLSPYPSRIWDSLYAAAAPAALDWIEFLHPMNKNVQRVSDPRYNLDVILVILSIIDAVLKPLIGTDRIVEFVPTTRIADYACDVWVNFHRYTEEPSGTLQSQILDWVAALCVSLPVPPDGNMPDIVSKALLQATKRDPRRLCRCIRQSSQSIRTPDDYEALENLYYVASNLVDDIPELAPSIVSSKDVVAVIESLSYALEMKAWRAVFYACRYLEQLWTSASSYRALELSIEHGAIDVLIRMATIAPPTSDMIAESYQKRLSTALIIVFRGFVSWRVLAAFHKKHGAEVVEKASELYETNPMFVDLVAMYQARYPLLESTQVERRISRQHCLGCCPDQDGSGKCCREADTTKLLRCSNCWDAVYCSIQCQRVHWRQCHRKVCDTLVGRTSARDMDFIGRLCAAQVRRNARAIIEDIKLVDPDRRYHYMLYVHLSNRHERQIVEIAGEYNGGKRMGTIVAVWEDGMSPLCEHVSGICVMELEALDVAARLTEMQLGIASGTSRLEDLAAAQERVANMVAESRSQMMGM